MTLRLYADFNACIDPGGDGRPGLVNLEKMGTLQGLCRARASLSPGMRLCLFTDSDAVSDIEVDATARWLSGNQARSPRGGTWVGEFDPQAFRDVPRTQLSGNLPCSRCSADLQAIF
jgi:hypothetical protein